MCVCVCVCVCVYIYIYRLLWYRLSSFSIGLRLLPLLNNCHRVLITDIDITTLELSEPPSSDFHFYNGLEQNTKQ